MAELASTGTTPLPPSYNKWSWGAALLNVVWGAKYGIDLAFLTLIPVLGIVVPFILGWKGNRWAWDRGGWKSIEQFEQTQRSWAFWGVITWFFISVALLIPVLFGVIHIKWQHSESYAEAMQGITQIEKIQELLGEPIKGRVVSVKHVSPEQIRLSVRLSGSRTSAVVHFYMLRIEKKWTIYRMTLYDRKGKAGVDFPLSNRMLMEAGEDPDNTKQYDVILEKRGNGTWETLAHVLSEMNKSLDIEAARTLIHQTPCVVFTGASRTGALKIRRKLLDYGAEAEVKESVSAP